MKLICDPMNLSSFEVTSVLSGMVQISSYHSDFKWNMTIGYLLLLLTRASLDGSTIFLFVPGHLKFSFHQFHVKNEH